VSVLGLGPLPNGSWRPLQFAEKSFKLIRVALHLFELFLADATPKKAISMPNNARSNVLVTWGAQERYESTLISVIRATVDNASRTLD
jgi:hypothetical protein